METAGKNKDHEKLNIKGGNEMETATSVKTKENETEIKAHEMAYQAEISMDNPGCFMLLIDQSKSMEQKISGKRGGKSKAQGVADVTNDLINDLIAKCTRPEGVRDYFDVGVIGYGDEVAPAFTGVLANRDLVPLSEVAQHPSGDKGTPELPFWVNPIAEGDTAMCAALRRAYDVLGDWVRKHPDSYPPIVINITDGEANDGDPIEPAHRLASLRTNDGNVLVFNCHISGLKADPIVFPYDEKGLPGYAPRLYIMSSILPPQFREAARNWGYDVVADTRGFAFNADLNDLVKFMDLGKHTLISQMDMRILNTMSSESARFVPSIRLAQYGVVNKKGNDMGQVKTFVVDMREGLIAFALVAFGGSNGTSDKWFALPWAALEWHPQTKKFVVGMSENILKNAPGMDKDKWLEEIDRWQEETDLELLDRYYTSHGYESYLGIVQRRITNIGSLKPDAKFEIKKDVAGEFRFNLVATNGEIIAVSQGYNAKQSALKGIESIKRNAAEAVIEDMDMAIV